MEFKNSDSIHVDPNHTKYIQLIPVDATDMGSIHDSANICAIEMILTSPENSKVPDSPIFFYGSASDPLSQSINSSSESVTPKGITKPHDKLLNTVLYIPSDLDSEPSFPDYSSSESSVS